MHQNYLPTAQPDYLEEVVTLRPTGSLSFSSEKKQRVDRSDGGSKETITLSKNNCIHINLQLSNLNSTNKDFILDLYCNINKADGLKKTFLFRDPVETEDYVCMFTDNLSESMGRNMRHGYNSFSLLAIGVDRNLISTTSWTVGSSTSTGYEETEILEPVVFGGDSITFEGESVVW